MCNCKKSNCTQKDCTCKVKIGSDCVTYTGDDLSCSGITKGTVLTKVIQELDTFICEKVDSIVGGVSLINTGQGAEIYAGDNNLGQKQIKSLISTDELITVESNPSDISFGLDRDVLEELIESYEKTSSIQNIGTGLEIYKDSTVVGNNNQFNIRKIEVSNPSEGIPFLTGQQNTNNITLNSKSLRSNNLNITETEGIIDIEIPTIFQGVDYYVNSIYTGEEETGTQSKPFKTLKNCLDKILNRGAFQDPDVNGGNEYNKWDLREGINFGAIRVIIQSYTQTTENLAINKVTYFLEREGISTIAVPSTSNLEWIIDMKELVDNVPKISGQLPYTLDCSIGGEGYVIFDSGNSTRKGYFRGYGYNSGDLNLEQPDSILSIGTTGGYIDCRMYKKQGLNYIPLYSDIANTIPITREGVNMTGYQTTDTPDYGAIQVEGANAIYRDSVNLKGTLSINCFEQHMIYCKEFGTIYGDEGRIYMRRNYQHVIYSSIENIDINPADPTIKKYYKPSLHVHDVYLKNGGGISYGGNFYSQENTEMNQGGCESFVCMDNSTTDSLKMCAFSANGGGTVHGLMYNHYYKSILNPAFGNFQNHFIILKSLKLDSFLFEEVISAVTNTGVTYTKSISGGAYIDSYIKDFMVGGNVRRKFTNMVVNSTIFIDGTTIKLGRGEFNATYPVYADNAAAIADNYTIGGVYRDNSGIIRVVI